MRMMPVCMVAEASRGGGVLVQAHYTEVQARDVIASLADALAYMHAKKIVHRDLKPENILLSSKDDRTAVVKLADLGFARSTRTPLHTRCGTPRCAHIEDVSVCGSLLVSWCILHRGWHVTIGGGGVVPSVGVVFDVGPVDPLCLLPCTAPCSCSSYVPPEILECVPYNELVYIWSLGVITFILLCGYPPFSNPNQVRGSCRDPVACRCCGRDDLRSDCRVMMSIRMW